MDQGTRPDASAGSSLTTYVSLSLDQGGKTVKAKSSLGVWLTTPVKLDEHAESLVNALARGITIVDSCARAFEEISSGPRHDLTVDAIKLGVEAVASAMAGCKVVVSFEAEAPEE